ncbi:MAG: hypothetical protein A2X47_02775 [Lentisphaerae bacterium GWF2_38_69]|nr:MAG: hypothetical protein A2X47_02775 [Lentisphaerae bacterium GWF2_38_69]
MIRYLIGIDLGTTNSVVYYIDKTKEKPLPELFKVPQLTEAGEISEEELLPSFIYIPDDKELPDGSLNTEWNGKASFCVGEFAKKSSPKVPLKVITSAKSWLCAENIDKNSPVLPWNRNNPEKQLSPVEAIKSILEHIKNAWNYKMASTDKNLSMEKQIIVVTVPASFDTVARELTVKAAAQIDLKIILLEEPQAAFYSWLNNNGEMWRKKVSTGNTILVCDIGGGTTDFSLIKVRDESGNLALERVAVGNHILLGGDNMDLTMAYKVATKINAKNKITLDTYQIHGLTYACREAKEALMADPKAKAQKLTVLGRGSSVIASTISSELSRGEVEETIIDGFFAECALDDAPVDSRRSGFKTFGLKYETDPSITKHLAQFLKTNCKTQEELPNCILFNGGVTKANSIRERITSVITKWANHEIKVLSGTNPDLAVAMGASCYANVREGKGIRIKAGSSYAYYLGIETSMPAVPGFVPPTQGLCVLPIGTEEGSAFDLDYSGLGLIVGENSEFRFYSSKIAREDKFGKIIDDIAKESSIEELPPLAVTLPPTADIPAGSLVPVKLRIEFTETGTLQVWCINEKTKSEWKLDFEVRKDSSSAN